MVFVDRIFGKNSALRLIQ